MKLSLKFLPNFYFNIVSAGERKGGASLRLQETRAIPGKSVLFV